METETIEKEPVQTESLDIVKQELEAMKSQISELSTSLKTKDEMLEQIQNKKQEIENEYNTLANRFEMLKANSSPVKTEQENVFDYFKQRGVTAADLTGVTYEHLYNLYVEEKTREQR